MQLSQLKPTTRRALGDRIGRGGKRGKTSGRGVKGQRAHGSHGIRAEIRDQIRKLPKLRGRGMHMNKQIGADTIALNLGTLAPFVVSGQIVDLVWLKTKGLVPKSVNNTSAVKILAQGNITVPVVVQNLSISAAARAMIVAVGGSVTP